MVISRGDGGSGYLFGFSCETLTESHQKIPSSFTEISMTISNASNAINLKTMVQTLDKMAKKSCLLFDKVNLMKAVSTQKHTRQQYHDLHQDTCTVLELLNGTHRLQEYLKSLKVSRDDESPEALVAQSFLNAVSQFTNHQDLCIFDRNRESQSDLFLAVANSRLAQSQKARMSCFSDFRLCSNITGIIF